MQPTILSQFTAEAIPAEPSGPAAHDRPVSVVVTCLNEAGSIGPCLQSLLGQHYDHYEIVVVDGGSGDGTLEIIQELAATDQRLHCLVERKQGTAAGRNAGIRAARHALIAFTDADCIVPPDWLTTLVMGLMEAQRGDPAVVAAGGGNIVPPDAPPFVQAIGIALDCFAGSFTSVQGRRYPISMGVPSLATLNVLYQKDALTLVQGFDESLASEAEDADLNFRLIVQGKKLVFLSHVTVHHHFRATPRDWARNMRRYGRGRARLLKRHPTMRHPQFLLPPAFLLAMAVIPLGFVHPVFFLPALYVPLILLYAFLLAARSGHPFLWHMVALVFIIQHFSYALGEVQGLIDTRIR